MTDAGRSDGLDGGMMLRPEGLILADEAPELVMAADLPGTRVVDHHVARPDRFELAAGTGLQDIEVLADGIRLRSGPRLLACQLDSTHEVWKPRHRISLVRRNTTGLPMPRE